MKSVKGLDILNSMVSSLPANIKGSGWESGTSPKSLVAFAGPHSPDAQSGSGTITVDKLGQSIFTCIINILCMKENVCDTGFLKCIEQINRLPCILI